MTEHVVSVLLVTGVPAPGWGFGFSCSGLLRQPPVLSYPAGG